MPAKTGMGGVGNRGAARSPARSTTAATVTPSQRPQGGTGQRLADRGSGRGSHRRFDWRVMPRSPSALSVWPKAAPAYSAPRQRASSWLDGGAKSARRGTSCDRRAVSLAAVMTATFAASQQPSVYHPSLDHLLSTRATSRPASGEDATPGFVPFADRHRRTRQVLDPKHLAEVVRRAAVSPNL
jgi:hypothetical protein